jgi:hypothetical protein
VRHSITDIVFLNNADRGSDNRSSSQEKPQGHLPIVSELRARPGSIQPSRVDVTVGTESQFPTSQIGGYGTYISTDYDRYKAHEVILDVDVESGHEK